MAISKITEAKDAERSACSKRPWYCGHRERMAEKIRDKGVDTLTENELLEQLLIRSIPRRDVKPIVADLMAEFGHLSAVLMAPKERLMQIKGIKERTVTFLAVIRRVCQEIAASKVKEMPILNNWEALLDYANLIFTGESLEKLYVLYLNAQLRLVKVEKHAVGCVCHVPVYPRDILKQALNENASAVILMHNHPSGDAHASEDDIQMTREISNVLSVAGIQLLEHLIVAPNRKVHSMKASGIL